MDKNSKLRRWELALMLSLCITFCHGFAFGAPGMAWWGVVFPGLTGTEEPSPVAAAKLESGEPGLEVRFRLLDWMDEMLSEK